MAYHIAFLARWSLIGLVLAILLKAESHSKKPLSSLYVAPSDIYTPDFYPNGTDLKLPMGTMRYWLFGNPEGRRVILIHGIATGAATYDKLGRSLAESGHQVLVYDLFGRGYSDAPAGLYDESLYTTQIALLLQKVGWDKTDVVGVSLGGGIAASFAAYYPEIVDRLVLIAPAGLMQEKDIPLTGKLVKLPLLSKIALHPWLRPVALRGITQFFKSSRKGDQTTADAVKVQKIAFHQFAHHPGFLRAFFGTLTDYPLHDLHERYKAVGQNKDLPVLVLWGDADKTVPFEHHKVLKEYVPQAKVSRYEGGGHDIILTDAERVDKEIADFLA